MKLLSTRTRARLWKLQDAVRHAATEREKVLKVLLNAREALAMEARREMLLEFSCVDQEYRCAVSRLASFVEKHGSEAADQEAVLNGDAP